MTKTHLRLYRGYETELDDADEFGTSDPDVRVRLGDLLPLVSMAQKMNFIWLKDFLDDEVCVTRDLHEVLQSFRSSRPAS